jgi:hypothetical protein
MCENEGRAYAELETIRAGRAASEEEGLERLAENRFSVRDHPGDHTYEATDQSLTRRGIPENYVSHFKIERGRVTRVIHSVKDEGHGVDSLEAEAPLSGFIPNTP